MSSKLYKELYTTHCDYDPLLNLKLQLLYQGGYQILTNAHLFLDQLKGIESNKAYQQRLKAIAYLPYLSQFITQFSASLFSETLEVKQQADAPDPSTQGDDMEDDFYKLFLECCDLERRSFHQFAQDILEKALSEICVYVSLDFPQGLRLNRAQEKADGLDQGYACLIPYQNVIDWKIDPATGKFIWVKEYEEIIIQDDPIQVPTHYFQFKFRTMHGSQGGWEVWKSDILPIEKKVNSNTKFTKDESETITTSFPEINLWRLQINKAYHVGQQIGSLCQEHYQRRSFMVSNSNKTCVALGVVSLGPDIGAAGDMMPPDFADMPSTPNELRRNLENEGWIVLRKTDKWSDSIEIVEAKGESHKFIAEELKELVQAMMQTLRQMNMTAQANIQAVGRSAASKMVDQHGTSMLLSVYERVIKDFTKLLFTVLAEGRGETINFAVEGLSISEPTLQRQEIVQEITSFGVDVLKLPDMWKSKYLNRMACELLDNNLTDKERMELSEKLEESIQAGDFAALDPQEATAAGNKMAQTTAQAPPGTVDKTAPGLSGNPIMSDGGHLSTGQHVDSNVVFDQLAQDYHDKDIQFVKQIPWVDKSEVPLSSIDFSNKDNWQASKEPDQVQMFVDKIKDGFDKPIILVNNPSNNNKMQVVDGHHRSLAYLQLNRPVPAYVGQIGQDRGPWDKLHAKQVGTKSQQSIQTQVSTQVSQSEKQ
jgi:hypothetical protein